MVKEEIIQKFDGRINGVPFSSSIMYSFTLKTLKDIETILGKEISQKDKKIVNVVKDYYVNMHEHLDITFKEIGEIAETGFSNAGKKLTCQTFSCYDPCLLDTEKDGTLKEILKEFSSAINRL